MAGWFVGPIMEKIINACSDYLEDQVGWQTGMKKELERLRENHPKIQAIVFAANQAQINDKNRALNKWIWQLRDAIDEADDVLDELECIKHKEQLTRNTEETKKKKFMSFLFESSRKILKIGDRGPNLKRLEEAVQKLDKVSADVTNFLHLLDCSKQEQKEQELDFYKTRETGSLPENDLIGRGKDKEFVKQWLRMPSNREHQAQALVNGTDLYKKISLLSIVGHGGMGKRTLLQLAMKIAKIVKKKEKIFRLEGLKEDECLQLLNSHAFAGSPLAAKVIGGVLNGLDERHWTNVLHSGFVSAELGQYVIFPILRLSYMFLPKHLQNCFAFCFIFRQDYRFDKDDLVKMWIALGFIQQPDHNQEWTMEDIGEMYFDVLVKKNFFDKFDDVRRYYKMHDLIHELAQSVSINECLRVEDGTKLSSIIPKTLRHLSVETTNSDIIKKIGRFKYLHSLFFFHRTYNRGLEAEIVDLQRLQRLLGSPKVVVNEFMKLIFVYLIDFKLKIIFET
ncbi:hypothetical protein M5K25_009457 [Dendrobium thyrsiflorum]|uniref:Uncharacterized protein n=1 Tax=Dendrobium thyrsiflorum TaxID=117978 RepID=A0ABD0V548_DENTH